MQTKTTSPSHTTIDRSIIIRARRQFVNPGRGLLDRKMSAGGHLRHLKKLPTRREEKQKQDKNDKKNEGSKTKKCNNNFSPITGGCSEGLGVL